MTYDYGSLARRRNSGWGDFLSSNEGAIVKCSIDRRRGEYDELRALGQATNSAHWAPNPKNIQLQAR